MRGRSKKMKYSEIDKIVDKNVLRCNALYIGRKWPVHN